MEIFAPGIISKSESEITAVFSPDGTEFYYSAKDPVPILKIIYSRLEDGILQDENVHAAVPEFGSLNEMNEGFSVMQDLRLTPQEKKDLRLGNSSSYPGLYCQNCEKCLPQCKGNFDIPTLMRSYMYAYG